MDEIPPFVWRFGIEGDARPALRSLAKHLASVAPTEQALGVQLSGMRVTVGMDGETTLSRLDRSNFLGEQRFVRRVSAEQRTVCNYGVPAFNDGDGDGQPDWAYVGVYCDDGSGAVVARDVASWDGGVPIAEHVTYGARVVVLYRANTGFRLKPGLLGHYSGIGLVVYAFGDNGEAVALWVPGIDADPWPIVRTELVEQTVLQETRLGPGLPLGRVFTEHPVAWHPSRIGTRGGQRGWRIALGGQFTAGATTAITIYPGPSYGVGFESVDNDGTHWRGVLRQHTLSGWDVSGFFDYNSDGLVNSADEFVTVDGAKPGSMIEVIT